MTHKVTNFIKQYFFMLALAAMFVGFSAFKIVDDPESGWYTIDVDEDDPNDQSTQEIVSRFGDEAPESEECNLANMAKPCQVHLNLTNFNSSTPIEDLTVQQAFAAGAVIGAYAREPEPEQ